MAFCWSSLSLESHMALGEHLLYQAGKHYQNGQPTQSQKRFHNDILVKEILNKVPHISRYS
jgi:hypothetical protein